MTEQKAKPYSDKLAKLVKHDHLRPPKILVAGEHGIGKTRFAAGGGDKTVFIPTEDGLGTLNVASFDVCKTYDDFLDAMNMVIEEDHSWTTVVIDSADWLDKLICEHLCVKHNKEDITTFGFGDGYKKVEACWRDVTNLCDKANARGMTIIFIVHTGVENRQDIINGNYQRTGLKMMKGSASVISEWCDIILHALIDIRVTTERDSFGNEKGRAVTVGDPFLLTIGGPTIAAKNRYGLPERLPLDWQAFRQAFAKSIKNRG